VTLRITVPVLTLRSIAGRLDPEANAEYAHRASSTWLDHFLVNGTIGGGETSTPSERRALLETWAAHVPTIRLLACAWEPADLDHARELGIRPTVVMRGLPDDAAALNLFARMPAGYWVYSHPKYSPATLTPTVAIAARAAGTLPTGGKICKVSLDDVTRLRAAAGPDFQLYDGRCRHLARSIAAGATGVIAVPLACLPADLPTPEDVAALQRVIDRTQALIDDRPHLADRIDLLTAQLRRSAAAHSPEEAVPAWRPDVSLNGPSQP